MEKNTKKYGVYYVFPDTNILLTNSPNVIDPDFVALLEEYKDLIDIKLVVSEVVIRELIEKKAQHMKKKITSFSENTKHISIFFPEINIDQPPYDKLKRTVKESTEKWFDENSEMILETPYPNQARWVELIDDAIKRNLPFEKGDKEKGFRDWLILEAFGNFCVNHTSNNSICLLSNDIIFRKTAKKRMQNDSRFHACETVSDLKELIDSDIALHDEIAKKNEEKRVQEIITAITEKAEKAFVTYNNRNSLFYAADLESRIRTKYDLNFSDPERLSPYKTQPDNDKIFFLKMISQRTDLPPMADGNWYFEKPSFLGVEQGDLFRWKSIVGFYRPYKDKNFINILENRTVYRLQHMTFIVEWNANVDLEFNISNATFISVILTKISFHEYNHDSLISFGFNYYTEFSDEMT